MDTVYLLMRVYPDCVSIDQEGNTIDDSNAPSEVVDVFASEEAANDAKKQCEDMDKRLADECDCDECEYSVVAKPLRYSPYE